MTKNNTNLIVAIVFLLGFLALWDKFVVSRYLPPPGQVKATPAKEKFEQAKLINEAKMEIAKPQNAKISESLPYLTLKDDHTEVTLESQGGYVSSWKIKEGNHWLQMLLPENHRPVSPFSIFPDLSFSLQRQSETEARLSASRVDGLSVQIQLALSKKPPFHAIDVVFQNPTSKELLVDTSLGWGSGVDKHEADTPYNEKDTNLILSQQAAVAFDGQVKRWKPGVIFKRSIDLEQTGAFQWLGVGNNHFFSALIASEKPITSVKVSANRKNPPLAVMPLRFTLRPGEQRQETYYLYVGAKKYDELKSLGYNLQQAVDFGFFGAISKVLLYLLKKFEAMTGNYGWAIIILTFLIQIVVFPLTIKNFKHSLRMKELQPQMKKIQEQFKSDPKRLQVETFNLYKRNGMKFMGMEGCFPVLLQIPLFFAFYSTLNVAFELRGAPWIFWIKDLAQHDPIYVLPIIMGAGMFLQQKLTAVAMDPAQARMMMFMPIMFTFMFLKLPAGLVLYWCVNSMTTIVITQFMKRRGPSPASS